MKLPIEDDFNDIVSKAQKGLELSTEKLSERANITSAQIRDLRKGVFDEENLRAAAQAMRLNEEALIAVAKNEWYPQEPSRLSGFATISTPFWEGFVNAYVVWDLESKLAIAFDTGMEAGPLISFVREQGLDLQVLYLTHTDPDHCVGVSAICAAFGCVVKVNEKEGARIPAGAEVFPDGYTSTHGQLKVRSMLTDGHTAGGTTFVLDGLDRRIAIVGDALFAGSMGGVRLTYDHCLNSMKRILELEPDTVLAPGHGPLTSVAEERRMNCFYQSNSNT